MQKWTIKINFKEMIKVLKIILIYSATLMIITVLAYLIDLYKEIKKEDKKTKEKKGEQF